MPEIDFSKFGLHSRHDREPGFIVVTPTKMGYVEADGTDIRVERVRVYDSSGILQKVYLRDTMGVRFTDLPDIEDDLDYLSKQTSD